MKKIVTSFAFFVSVFAFSQVGIGAAIPAASAMLDVSSTRLGFLLPRMTSAQRTAIALPVAGLQIWCLDCGIYGEAEIYDGLNWKNISGSAAQGIVSGAPTDCVATAGIEQASVAFLAPLSTGGSAITSYTVSVSPGGQTATGSASPVVVTGLTSGSSYVFTVVATNSGGNSLGSIASVGVIPFAITAICDGFHPTDIVEKVSSTGKTWMDRNLGASRSAISTTDFMSYGCLYQWGRGNDGHASMNWVSATVGIPVNGYTTSLALTDTPGDALFITTSTHPFDWRVGNNDTRWQVDSQVNNPCPTGFHVPTAAQFEAESTLYLSYGSTVFPLAGSRSNVNSSLNSVSRIGYYWSSSFSGIYGIYRGISDLSTGSVGANRANGFSVRCIKD